VDLAPAIRDLRKDLVVMQADELASEEPVILEPAATDDQVA